MDRISQAAFRFQIRQLPDRRRRKDPGQEHAQVTAQFDQIESLVNQTRHQAGVIEPGSMRQGLIGRKPRRDQRIYLHGHDAKSHSNLLMIDDSGLPETTFARLIKGELRDYCQ
jgi:hypothetical protein